MTHSNASQQTKQPSIWANAFHLMRPMLPLALTAAFFGAISGLATAALLATVNRALHADSGDLSNLLMVFGGLCLLALGSTVVSDITNNVVGQRVIAALRRDLGAKILAAPLVKIERYKLHRLIAVLTEDVDTISDFSFVAARLLIAVAVILGSLAYLATLSVPLFLLAVTMIIVGVCGVAVARGRAVRNFLEARDGEDDLQKHYRAITEGAKELRINRPRRHQVYENRIVETVARICRLQIRGVNYFVGANAFASFLFFMVIGAVLTVQLVSDGIGSSTTTGFVLVLLYVRGPIEQLAGALPLIGRTQVAFRKLAELSRDFDGGEELRLDAPLPEKRPFSALELRNVSYGYPAPSGGGDAFRLGPIDLKIERGEVLFVVGENGCGKTTLIKLLLGLYTPHQGEVRLDGHPVSPDWRDDYRQHFSAVFFDYFLFEDFTPEQVTEPETVNGHLSRLDLAHKVAVTEAGFSTTELSTGQRKRLALIQLYMEQRPILVFDEWAAEQDPTFRRLFYQELLPEMKRQGKTLVVISHDDRYFGSADRVVQLRDGKLIETPNGEFAKGDGHSDYADIEAPVP